MFAIVSIFAGIIIVTSFVLIFVNIFKTAISQAKGGSVNMNRVDYMAHQNAMDMHSIAHKNAVNMHNMAHNTAINLHNIAHTSAMDFHDMAHMDAVSNSMNMHTPGMF